MRLSIFADQTDVKAMVRIAELECFPTGGTCQAACRFADPRREQEVLGRRRDLPSCALASPALNLGASGEPTARLGSGFLDAVHVLDTLI